MVLPAIPWRPDDRTLRRFAALWLIALGALAAWQHVAHQRTTVAVALAAVAAAVGIAGLARPPLVRPVFLAATLATMPLGWMVSQALLAAIFYGLVTPLGLIGRIAGRDALGRRRRPCAESYWSPKPSPDGAAQYLKQY